MVTRWCRGGRWVYPRSLSLLWSALDGVGFIQGRLGRKGSPWRSLGSSGFSLVRLRGGKDPLGSLADSPWGSSGVRGLSAVGHRGR